MVLQYRMRYYRRYQGLGGVPGSIEQPRQGDPYCSRPFRLLAQAHKVEWRQRTGGLNWSLAGLTVGEAFGEPMAKPATGSVSFALTKYHWEHLPGADH
jgi:hypothetical protein